MLKTTVFKRLAIVCIGLVYWSVNSKAQNFATLGNHSDDVESVAMSADGNFVATGSWDNTVQIFKGDTTFPYFQTLTGHRSAVSALGFSDHGMTLVTGGNDFKLMIWEKAMSGKFELTKELTHVHTAGINGVLVGGNGNMIYSGSDDGKIVAYSQRTNKKWVIDNRIPVNGIALKSSMYIYCADESTEIKLYDLSGNVIKKYKGHSDVVNAVACNGRYLVSGSSDKTAIIWDAFSGKQLHVLRGHTWKINSVTISKDGKYVITGSSDGTTKIWDIETASEYKSFAEANGKVRQVTISRDMKYVFSAFQVDSINGTPTYGLSVWETGLTFQAPQNTDLAQQLLRLKKQRAVGNPGNNVVTGSPRSSNPGYTAPKPKEIKGEVIKETNEIQITIEDE